MWISADMNSAKALEIQHPSNISPRCALRFFAHRRARSTPGMRERSPGSWELVVSAGRGRSRQLSFLRAPRSGHVDCEVVLHAEHWRLRIAGREHAVPVRAEEANDFAGTRATNSSAVLGNLCQHSVCCGHVDDERVAAGRTQVVRRRAGQRRRLRVHERVRSRSHPSRQGPSAASTRPARRGGIVTGPRRRCLLLRVSA